MPFVQLYCISLVVVRAVSSFIAHTCIALGSLQNIRDPY